MSARLSEGGVVDAVTGHRDDVALALEHVDEAHLVLRCDTCDHTDIVDLILELGIGEGCEVGTGHGASFDSELGSDGGRRGHVVAGDHPCADSSLLAARDRVLRLLARRIDDGNKREKCQLLNLVEQRAVGVERGGIDVP
jgi:hypothetical protein